MRLSIVKLTVIFCLLLFLAAAHERQQHLGIDSTTRMFYDSFRRMLEPAQLQANECQSHIDFPWEKLRSYSASSRRAALDTVVARCRCERVDDKLVLTSSFPAGVDADEQLFSMSIARYRLTNEKGEAVKLKPSVCTTGFGYEPAYPFRGDESGSTDANGASRVTVSASTLLEGTPANVSGALSVSCKLATAFDYVRLTRQHVGKNIRLGSTTLRLLSMDKVSAVVKVVSGRGDFDYLITRSNNLPYRNGITSSIKLAQQDYDYLVSVKDFTLEAFAPYFQKNRERLLRKDSVKELTVIKSEGEIVNLYLYKVSTSIEQVFVLPISA
ncbi:hypothetical protein [uncultured Acetobacteroides sp.]|uniref:hypothetical protein n=1 Tax=uncultured Acetobacteroides sp. TaxID=1760811 RepID=UPI0029F540AF|nr:hypothetical protein [uncultured Acetobacteroides sp.]